MIPQYSATNINKSSGPASPASPSLGGRQGGQAALLTVVLILLAMLILIGTASNIALRASKISELDYKSKRSYFLSESGAEDATYRLIQGKNTPASYDLSLYGATTTITVSDVLGGKEILSSASLDTLARAVQTAVKAESSVSFNYGIQVGEGGITMGNGSVVVGNVFSNGDIIGNGKDKTTITGTAKSAGTHLVKDIRIEEDAWGYNFDNCTVVGTARYANSFSSNCSAAATEVLAAPLEPETFPIPESLIDSWKADAEAGGTLSGFSVGNNSSETMGPKKISGNLTLGNSSTLTLTGIVWVTGTINFGNGPILKLDSSYGQLSGVLIVDGLVDLGNQAAVFEGSGEEGSYLMLLSTFGPGDAIKLGNKAEGAIFYAPDGVINAGNNLDLKEATGYGLKVGNDTTITYESGLADLNFSSGSSGGWTIDSWKEVTP
ncbi:MAG: hypothetical protein Q8R12_02245 [bacterium]|nr:hypothetical protein [bacterium]